MTAVLCCPGRHRQYHQPVDWVIEDIRRFGQKQLIFVDLNLISDKGIRP